MTLYVPCRWFGVCVCVMPCLALRSMTTWQAFSEALVLRTMFLIQHLRINVACATADDDEVYTYGSLGCHTCQDHTHAFLAEFTEWSVLTRERKYVEEYQLRAEDQ